MTNAERRKPDLINESRMKRIARGSGHGLKDIKGLMERFSMARVMMKEMGRATGMMGKVPGLREASGLRRLKRQGVNLDPSMLSGLQGMAEAEATGHVPGMEHLGLGVPGERKQVKDAAKRKADRKKARNARKKNRRK